MDDGLDHIRKHKFAPGPDYSFARTGLPSPLQKIPNAVFTRQIDRDLNGIIVGFTSKFSTTFDTGESVAITLPKGFSMAFPEPEHGEKKGKVTEDRQWNTDDDEDGESREERYGKD